MQVVSTAHALARAGIRVEVPVSGDDPEGLLSALGLSPLPSLALSGLGRAAAPLRLRALLAAYLLRTRGRGVVHSRHLRYADGLLRATRGRVRLLYEAHEVARREALAAGQPTGAALAAEARVLAGARWVVTNAPGTLALLRADHGPLAAARVCPNGAGPWRPPRPDAAGVGVVGSVRPYKDPLTVARAAALRGGGVTWVGVRDGERAELDAASRGLLITEPPVPRRDVPDRLARFRTLLLPLSPGDGFGAALTNPLKAWDAFGAGVPLVAADTPAVHALAPPWRPGGDGAWIPYTPGDAASLVAALGRAEDPAIRGVVVAGALRRRRTWDDRAAELLALVRS